MEGSVKRMSTRVIIWPPTLEYVPKQIKNSNLTMYADNHQMHISGKDMHTIENTLNTEAQVASSWYKNNSLQANHDKFHILAINPRQHNTSENKNDTTLCIDCHEIPSKEHIKLLGVYMDEKFNFNKQISEVCKKAEIFRFKNKAYNLRNSDFEIPRFETISFGKHSIRYLGPYIWWKRSNIKR